MNKSGITPAMRIRFLLSVPFIYGMAIPLALFHLALELYHRVCFPLYKIPLVRARDYFVFDRHRTGGLDFSQRLQCLYCAYANGLMAYSREIIARTEAFWCPLAHEKRPEGTHRHYDAFCPFEKGESFVEHRKKIWEELEGLS